MAMVFKFLTIFLILAFITLVVSQTGSYGTGPPCRDDICGNNCGKDYLGFCRFGACNCQSLETGKTCVLYECKF